MNYKSLFIQLHPDFFSPGRLDYMNDSEIYEELIMTSTETDYEKIDIPVPENIVFKFADTSDKAEMKKIQIAVAAVDDSWPQYFTSENARIYCAYSGEDIASFCLAEEMGLCTDDGVTIKIAGPGCVGTVPEFRRKGIGLKMVQKVTKILFEEGYDISWIHYTGVSSWYQKLGYKPVLKWNKTGFC